VSIARAIIREPKILIFDDCLSAVDTETEDQILKNLRRIMQGRTSILVSHRVSTVRHADKIIVLQNGSIAEEGTHQALIDKKGIYFDLYRKQLLEDEKIV
jgi:ATP-binding cassette subfamily B protein